MICRSFLVLLLWGLPTVVLAGPSFFDPTPMRHLESEYWSAVANGSPHQAVAALSRWRGLCDLWPSLDPDSVALSQPQWWAEANGLCAIAYGESLERTQGFFRLSLLGRYRDHEMQYRLHAAGGKPKLLFDAALTLAAPPERVDRVTAALVALAFLRGDALESVALSRRVEVAEARAQLRAGNRNAAEAAIARLPEPNADWIRGQMADPRLWRERYHFGWGVGALLSPLRGVGLSFRWYDDRVGDGPLGIDFMASLATQKFAEGRVGLRYALVGVPWWATAALSVRHAEEGDFGSLPNPRVGGEVLRGLLRAEGSLGVRRRWSGLGEWGLGWKVRMARRVSGSSVGDDDVLVHGPALGVSWDNRDSREDAQKGFLLAADAALGVPALGSEYSLADLSARAEWSGRLFSPIVVRIRTDWQWVRSPPFLLLPATGRDSFIPGFREMRYRAREVLGMAAVEWRFRPFSPLTAALYSSAIVAPERVWSWGAALEWSFSRYRDRRGRIEGGRSGESWLVQASLAETF